VTGGDGRTQSSTGRIKTAGNVIARTTFDYDNYDKTALASESGLAQWDGSVPAARGNLTTKSVWLLGSSPRSLDTNYAYDVAGSLVGVTDPKGNATSISYSGAYANAFPTQVTFALGSQYNVQTSYDFGTGKPTSFTDMNGNVRNYKYVDLLDRLTEADLPDGGVTTFGYCDAGSSQACPSTATPANSITKTVKQNSCSATASIVTDALYDGLGRTTKTHAYENSGSIVVQTTFDGMGRKTKVSNPMRTETPTDFTTTLYDALGRVQSVTAPDSSASTSVWQGSKVTMTDAAGVTRDLFHDAFGRLTKVTEHSSGRSLDTNYIYDLLDDLTGVCQGGTFDSTGTCQGSRPRSFVYDSLKRLTSATNPESGNVSYSYDDNGNLWAKGDARVHVTCYGTLAALGGCNADGYDPINRLLHKSYRVNQKAGGGGVSGVLAPAVTYLWDTVSKGNLTSVSTSASNAQYSSTTQYLAYDTMGRVTQSSQTTGGFSVPSFYYTYNLAGGLETEKYPTQRTIQTCYDTAGRPSGVTGTPLQGNSIAYASGVTYAPHGALQSMLLGNTLSESRTYNNRLQPTAISVGSIAAPRSGFGADLYYCPNKTATCTTNNGNLQTETLSILGLDQNFNYDSLNRLSSATETGSSWSQNYGYDDYGNRWVSPGVTTSPFTPIASSNFDTNNRLQIQNTQYDLAGNLQQLGGYTSVWDSEERLFSSSINGVTTSYAYDGDGHRVLKQSPAATTVYLYDAFGELAAEYSTASTVNPDCVTCYLSTDHLGSTRLVTDGGHNVVARHDYLPFGEEVPSTYGGRSNPALLFGAVDNVNQKFTGKERDSESGLDYFGARYYGSALGRFTSPDWSVKPVPVPYADLANPQSLNQYSYVLNNPLGRADADGHCPAEDQCSKITVTAQVAKEPTVKTDPPKGGKQTATVEGEVHYTIKDGAKPLAGTQVHEVVTNQVSRDGVQQRAQTTTRDDKTNEQGVIGDQVSHSYTAIPGLAEGMLTDSVNTKETTQVLTITSPSGAVCQCTEKRTLTNADANGQASDEYRIDLKTPKVQMSPAQTPPKPQ